MQIQDDHPRRAPSIGAALNPDPAVAARIRASFPSQIPRQPKFPGHCQQRCNVRLTRRLKMDLCINSCTGRNCQPADVTVAAFWCGRAAFELHHNRRRGFVRLNEPQVAPVETIDRPVSDKKQRGDSEAFVELHSSDKICAGSPGESRRSGGPLNLVHGVWAGKPPNISKDWVGRSQRECRIQSSPCKGRKAVCWLRSIRTVDRSILESQLVVTRPNCNGLARDRGGTRKLPGVQHNHVVHEHSTAPAGC